MVDENLRDTGETDLPVVVCLHSLFLDASSFDDLVEAGRGRFRFVRPTFLGQGERTDEATATVTMDEAAKDVVATLEAAGLSRYALLGQSMGGDVAVRIAAAQPDAVQALVLVGSSARHEPDDQRAAFGGVCDQIEASGFDEGLQQVVLEIMLGATTRADAAKADLVDAFRRQIASLSPGLCHAARGVVEREDASDLLDGLQVPALVINGTDDVARPPAWTADVVRRLPDVRHHQLDGVGHSPTQEAPEVVQSLLFDFLDGVLRS
ncbi:pimeloyl-ACP methyl ester carboxylesterase [Nocardioides sp. J9]|uniref:alpha/beta fold hydrolase n=1 Tax=unclassified Nocardioides TaxID=2615069 RepID=UPI0004ACA9A3|nr:MULTISPECIES: alpha/beta hydrolase [unclassified Nocardioides]TWH02693.1 pimeloyl-ACP methyl ester carboxylesterase [Nocardioides sp. J9]